MAPLNRPPLLPAPDHAYYFAGVVGSDSHLASVRAALQGLGFEARVFKKLKGTERAKQVDIALATAMVAGACDDAWDVAVLVSGDGDYIPAIQEVKRRQKKVYGWFFREEERGGLSPHLHSALDVLFPFENQFLPRWSALLAGDTLPGLSASSSNTVTG